MTSAAHCGRICSAPRTPAAAEDAPCNCFFLLICASFALCMSLKIEHTVRLAEDALAAGNCVVIGLQSTGESALDADGDDSNARPGEYGDQATDSPRTSSGSIAGDGIEEMDLGLTPADMDTDPNKIGFASTCRVQVMQGISCLPVHEQAAFVARIQSITFEPSPLDFLIDRLGGPGKVFIRPYLNAYRG
jgi:hypothetical protein